MHSPIATPEELLREVTRLYVRAQREAANCCGTTPTQSQIIMELAHSAPMPMNELGRRLSLEKSWVSRAIEGLVNEGLVTKSANPGDSRSWLVALSPAGRRRHKALNAQLAMHSARLMRAFTSEQQRMIGASLTLLLGALRTEAGFAVAPAVDHDA